MSVEFVPGQQGREELFFTHWRKAEHLAYRQQKKGLSLHEFLTFVIDVDDPTCTSLVNSLMPNHNWNQYRLRGERPVLQKTVAIDNITQYLWEIIPGIRDTLTTPAPAGYTKMIVMANGGASIYLIPPRQHYQD